MNFPKIFSVETVRGCNLRCPLCAVGCGKTILPKKHMTIGEYDTIANKISPYASHVALHIWGEPMLNRDIFSIISRTLQFASAGIHTNANCLSDEDAAKLAVSGASVSVSLDGMTQETYGAYRIGGSLDKAINVLKILKKHHAAAKMTTSLGAQFLVFAHNVHEVPKFLAFCKSIGVPGTTKVPHFKLNPVIQPHVQRPPFDLNQVLSCRDPYDVCTILADGSIVLCCYDYDASIPLGNLFSQSLEDIWQGPIRAKLLQDFANKQPPKLCLEGCLLFS